MTTEHDPFGTEFSLRKMSIYATAGVDEYGIVNLVDKQEEQFLEPERSVYQRTATIGQCIAHLELIAQCCNSSELAGHVCFIPLE